MRDPKLAELEEDEEEMYWEEEQLAEDDELEQDQELYDMEQETGEMAP